MHSLIVARLLSLVAVSQITLRRAQARCFASATSTWSVLIFLESLQRSKSPRTVRLFPLGFLLSRQHNHLAIMPNLFVLFSYFNVSRNKTLSPLILCIITTALASVCADSPVVETPLGAVRGHYLQTREGRTISAFTSVPYAVPPVGELRFKVSLLS